MIPKYLLLVSLLMAISACEPRSKSSAYSQLSGRVKCINGIQQRLSTGKPSPVCSNGLTIKCAYK